MHRLPRLAVTLLLVALVIPAGLSAVLAAPRPHGGPLDDAQHRQLRAQRILADHSDRFGHPRPDLWLAGVNATHHMKIAAGMPWGSPTKGGGAQRTGATAGPLAGAPVANPVTGVQWTQIGPAPLRIDANQNFQGSGPDSGQVLDVAIDPRNSGDQVIYIATDDGGIWKSTDGGTSWAPKTDFMPSLSMGAVALDPANPSIVYAGSGNPAPASGKFTKGVGIYKSIDGGDTWTVIGAGIFTGKSIRRIVLPSAGVLVVATSAGVYRSADGGQNFGNNAPTFNNGSPVLNGAITDLALDTATASTVYAAVSGTGIFVSTDSGATFPAASNLFTSTNGAPTGALGFISFSQSTQPNNQTIYATAQGPSFGLFKSTNTGSTWSKLNAANAPAAADGGCQCGYDQTVGVDPQDATRVYIGFQELWLSTDGGATFGGSAVTSSQVHWDHHALRFSPQTHWGGGGAPTRLYVGTDGGIATSGNGGTNWTNIDEGIATNLLQGFDIGRGSGANNVYSYAGAQDTGISQHTPTSTGTDWHLNIDGDGGSMAVDPTDPTRAYSIDDGGFVGTAYSGSCWQPSGACPNNPAGNGLPTIFLVAIDAANHNDVYASSDGGSQGFFPSNQFYQSTDQGQNFTLIKTFTANVTAIATTALDQNTIWVGLSNGTLQYTTNALQGTSATWTAVTVTGSPGLGIGGVAIDPTNSAVVTVVYNGFSNTAAGLRTKHVFQTPDSGTTWSDISGTDFGPANQNVPDLPVHSVVIDPGTTPHTIIIANDAGVLRTADGGASWQVLGVGLPTVDSTTLAIDTSVSPPVLRVATFGRSTFQLTAATGPLLAVNADLAFGLVPLGSSATLPLQIFNVGSSDLHISSITRVGSPDFAITSGPPTPVTVTPGEEIDYTVRFTPTLADVSPGATATFQINSDDPNQPVFPVPASGTAGVPQITLSGSLDFGTVARGTTATRDITVNNTGNAPLVVNGVAFDPGSDPAFSVVGPGTPQTIAAGSHLAFTIQFAPPANSGGGTRTGTLRFTSTDPFNPQVTAPATGIVGIPNVVLSGTALQFGNVPVDDRTTPYFSDQVVTITNQASCPLCDLTLQSLPISGPNAGDFTVVSPSALPVTIAAGNSLNVTVRFNPSDGGMRSATLTVNTDDPVNPSLAVGLVGAGLLPAIGATPTPLIFGPTVFDPLCGTVCGQSLGETIANTGNAELILDKLIFAGSAAFSGPGVTNPLTRVPLGHSFVESVSFHPTGGASRAVRGTLQIEDDLNGESTPIIVTVPLCGESVGRGIRVLVYDTSGNLVSNVDKLSLQSHGLTIPVNIQLKNQPLVTINPPTSCQTIQFQYENQNLQAAGTTVQRGSYYTLTVSVGSKHATTSFTLNVNEFKIVSVTVQ